MFSSFVGSGEIPRKLDPMASWQSSWWLLIRTVFMPSALLQVIFRKEVWQASLCLLTSIILDRQEVV